MDIVKFQYNGQTFQLNDIVIYSDIVKQLGKNPKNIYYLEVNGQLTDLASPVLEKDFYLNLYDSKGYLKNQVLWHTTAHTLAQAVHRIYGSVKEAIGPVTERGFFEDIDLGSTMISKDDFPAIEQEMQSIIKADYQIEKYELSKEEALDFFKDNPYKIENIKKIPQGAPITVYKQGEYQDLCKGPHLYSTGQIGIVELTNVSSAYFQGDASNPSLQRIAGISFVDKKEKRQHEMFMEEAKKRDHRKLGQELNLFSLQEEGTGFPFWHANGTELFNTLINYARLQNIQRGYSEIKTPQVLIDDLWKKSGHYSHFHENMYFTEFDERSFALKPMNCPGGCLVYNSSKYSYRNLPLRQAEFGLVHRHELSGSLHGLFRVRSFTQDDAHIFCTPEQLQTEILSTVEYTLKVYEDVGFQDTQIFVSTRPEKSIGTDQEWNEATDALINALASLNLDYSIKNGEGAFYGPKIEFNIRDTLGRFWQCGTIQVDFSMPKRFELSYEGSDGQQHTPIMIHRAIFGSLERFIGILLEHYAGKLPIWLSPIQVQLLNISDVHIPYLKSIQQTLLKEGIRVKDDIRSETLGYKIRHARNLRIPLIVVIGDEEVKNQTITVRFNNVENQGENKIFTVQEFISYIKSCYPV